MTLRRRITQAVFCIGSAIIGVASAQTTGTQPQPPPQICVNSQCVATKTSPAPDPVSRAIKWHPGHYMASGAVLYAGTGMPKIQTELDDLNNQDAILGYRVWVTWGALEPTRGNYDYSVIDAVLARLKTAYNKPKRLVIGFWLYGQHALGSNDVRVVPKYILQDQQYGASPVAGSYGWWGQSDNGASTGMYAPALYYPAVMDRFIAAVQALGRHLDGDPNVEAIYIQEDATIAQAASAFKPVDPHYSDAAWLAQIERLLTASTAAFPHTSVVMANSWFDRPASGVALQKWMAANRIAPGSADTWGQSSLDAYGPAHLSDGIQTMLGVSQSGGNVDLRPTMRAMVEVQSPDMVGNYFAKYGGPWAPADLINAFNKTYHASHVFWTHLVGTETVLGGTVPEAAKWPNLADTCAKMPLTHTDYPANYP
ncbi:MAG: hypothetical protein ABJD53_01830 [Gammaproteobacteria bacterium]